MTKDEIKALVAAKIAGQGSAIDAASVLPTILDAIVDAIPEEKPIPLIEFPEGTYEKLITEQEAIELRICSEIMYDGEILPLNNAIWACNNYNPPTYAEDWAFWGFVSADDSKEMSYAYGIKLEYSEEGGGKYLLTAFDY